MFKVILDYSGSVPGAGQASSSSRISGYPIIVAAVDQTVVNQSAVFVVETYFPLYFFSRRLS
jgi:hypothetical protein